MNNNFKIKDPIHNTMIFDTDETNWLVPILDTEVIQRLRHIKQMSISDWFFPGSVHTRFNHSIGCCYIGKKIAEQLQLNFQQKQKVMLACLLHDVGHGPFSHTFENIFYQKSIYHEHWTPYFLKDITNNKNIKNCKELKNIEFDKISNIICRTNLDNILLADIVASQLDADRLDYLLRDSHFCGVTYGTYDLSWLLNSLTVVKYLGKKRLGVTVRGIGVVEQFLMARRLMTQNVYQMSKKKICEHLFLEFIKSLSHALLKEQDIFQNFQNYSISKFLINVAKFNNQMKISKKKEQQNLILNFMQQNYHIYKKLQDYDLYFLLRECNQLTVKHPAINIAKKLHNRCLPLYLNITDKKINKAQNLINAAKQVSNLDDWQLKILSFPHKAYLSDDLPILILKDNQQVTELHKQSTIMNLISRKVEISHLIIIDKDALKIKVIRECYKELRKLI